MAPNYTFEGMHRIELDFATKSSCVESSATMKNFTQRLRRNLKAIPDLLAESRYRRICSDLSLGAYDRIYHVHIRKTGGTSINKMFLGIDGADGNSEYEKLCHAANFRRVSETDKVFVGWKKSLIERGNYFYAFSHIPYHSLKLPEKTFTFSCFRNPVSRICSHFRMLKDYHEDSSDWSRLAVELDWTTGDFDFFLDSIPKDHLCNQLFMFSKKFCPDEAYASASSLSRIIDLRSFEGGIAGINLDLGLNLEPIHTRKSSSGFEPTVQQKSRLIKLLTPELMFLEKLGLHYQLG